MKSARISPPVYLGIALIAITVLVSSCGSPSAESTQPASPAKPTEAIEASPTPTQPDSPESESPMPDQADLPEQVADQVKTAIAQSTDIAADAIQITSAEPQTWPNGCLGLANPDEFCTQALVEGWRVEATDGATTWIYRTDATGSQVRLEM